MHLGQTQLVLEKKRDKFNETYLQVTAEDVPHDAHVVLNVVHGESVHAKELGEQGLAVPLHNVRVILRQIFWSTLIVSTLFASIWSIRD